MASATVPGTPGVPQAATVLLTEDFENAPTPTPRRLNTYVGANGQTYTADTPYLTNCNGNVVEFNSTNLAASNCNGNNAAFSGIRQMAHALGTFAGDSTPNDNHAVSGWTLAAIPAGQTRALELAPQIPLAVAGRFIIASVDVVALTCFSPPVYTIAVTSGTTTTTLGSSLNVCGSGVNSRLISTPAVGAAPARDMRAATLTSDTAALVTGNTVGLTMRNLTTVAGGNDGSFDNLRIIDATPQLDKSFSAPVGGTSTLTLTVTNTSELAAKPGWSFDDDLPTGMTAVGTPTTTCPNGVASTSSGGARVTVSGDLTIGMASCTVTVSVRVSDPGTYTNGPSNITASAGLNPPADATVTFAASMTLAKSVSPTSVAAAGDQVTYSFLLSNTGDVEIVNPAVTETAFTGSGGSPTVTCPAEADPLSVGEQVTCTATYTVTQADVDRGGIDNTAVATGATPGGTRVDSPSSSAQVVIPFSGVLDLTKTANPVTVSAAGQVISYDFVVTNNTNQTLANVRVAEDAFSGTGTPPTVTCPAALGPGEQATCTATYAVTQDDMNAGTITNTATAHGDPLSGGPTVDSAPSSAVVSAPHVASLTLVKSADPVTLSAAGQTVVYSFVVTNTGNVSLSGITVSDQLAAPAGPAVTVVCPSTTLDPGASTTCTATYTATQADVDHGSIVNTATVTATAPGGDQVTGEPSTVTIPVPTGPAITLVKSANPGSVSQAGDTVTYSFLISNTGNVTLSSVSVIDTVAAPAGPPLVVNCPSNTLSVGASMTCSAVYVVRQSDVDHGSIGNTATATGVAPDGTQVGSPPSDAAVSIPATASMAVTKTADPASVGSAGDSITFSVVVTNTGNVTLTGLAVADTLAAPAGPEITVTCPSNVLAPGESTTCTSSPYTVTQADTDHGSVSNTATASATAPDGGTTTSPSSSATVPVVPAPAITLVKTADPTTVSAAGQTITYAFLVTNTGNVTLTDITVLDTPAVPAGPAPAVTCPVATLAVGGSTTCTARYTATQVDVDHGSIDNTATATGTSPDGGTATSASSASVLIPPDPSLTLVKSADPATAHTVGQTITFNFVVTNTGNVTLTDIAVADTLTAPAEPEVTVTCPSAELAPGESTTCTSSPYTVTRADADHGSVDNTATATGTSPDGSAVESEPSTASAVVDVPQEPTPDGPPTMPDTGPSVINQAACAALAIMLGIATSLVAAYRRKSRTTPGGHRPR
ncbi:hypothetical protein AB0A74_01035 [Saccharothrix sp. NPDC042600]|uniref:DUF7507 domain-containing protein n=1 Tax=Saccharothrix TaxID=2071 RepID=UPI00340D79D2|nr:hypothetical protein GCM10017745_49110 [Saccharothrix mutabilis subsp. capreolus]